MRLIAIIKAFLYRNLSLENYLRVVSWLFFAGFRLGIARRSEAYEYPHYLRRIVRKGDFVIDIGANLGYYTRIFARLVGQEGKVWAVEPVKPILEVLRHNLRRYENVSIVPFALGTDNRNVLMVNDSARITGYLGTGRSHVLDESPETDAEIRSNNDAEFQAEMRRGSELFAELERIDFIKCDVEGYESTIVPEIAPLIERHRPVVLLETGGANRRPMIEFFRTRGYAGYVLSGGRLVSVMQAPKGTEKDIFFIPGHRHS